MLGFVVTVVAMQRYNDLRPFSLREEGSCLEVQMVYKRMHDTSCCVPSLFGVQNPGVSDPPPIEAGYEERRNQHAHQEPGYCLGSQLTEVSSGV